MAHTKATGKKAASNAAKVLQNPNSTKAEKSAWSCPSLVDTKQLGDVLRKAPPPLVDCGRQIPEGRMSTVGVG
ncbi:MAG: hypothetical protein M3Q71_07810, partial [Chloroflexota bacterium]|nr:hypothetical protein [Chloroflexota bacterium]